MYGIAHQVRELYASLSLLDERHVAHLAPADVTMLQLALAHTTALICTAVERTATPPPPPLPMPPPQGSSNGKQSSSSVGSCGLHPQDDINSIARKVHIPVAEIRRLNPQLRDVSDTEALPPNTFLKLPCPPQQNSSSTKPVVSAGEEWATGKGDLGSPHMAPLAGHSADTKLMTSSLGERSPPPPRSTSRLLHLSQMSGGSSDCPSYSAVDMSSARMSCGSNTDSLLRAALPPQHAPMPRMDGLAPASSTHHTVVRTPSPQGCTGDESLSEMPQQKIVAPEVKRDHWHAVSGGSPPATRRPRRLLPTPEVSASTKKVIPEGVPATSLTREENKENIGVERYTHVSVSQPTASVSQPMDTPDAAQRGDSYRSLSGISAPSSAPTHPSSPRKSMSPENFTTPERPTTNTTSRRRRQLDAMAVTADASGSSPPPVAPAGAAKVVDTSNGRYPPTIESGADPEEEEEEEDEEAPTPCSAIPVTLSGIYTSQAAPTLLGRTTRLKTKGSPLRSSAKPVAAVTPSPSRQRSRSGDDAVPVTPRARSTSEGRGHPCEEGSYPRTGSNGSDSATTRTTLNRQQQHLPLTPSSAGTRPPEEAPSPTFGKTEGGGNKAVRGASEAKPESYNPAVQSANDGNDDDEFDTINGISETYGVSVEDVLKWNPYLAVYGVDEPLPADLPIVLPISPDEEDAAASASPVPVAPF